MENDISEDFMEWMGKLTLQGTGLRRGDIRSCVTSCRRAIAGWGLVVTINRHLIILYEHHK